MKKLLICVAVLITALTGCTTQQKATTSTNDDVYSNPKYSNKPIQPHQKNMDLSVPQQVSSPDSASTVKSGSGTWYNDYNDYSKSSPQQGSVNSQGGNSNSGNDAGYVDPNLYDNTYSSNPDVNLYIGSSYDPFFWGSSVSIGCGFGWGWDSYYWGYPYSSWYYPYYGYYPYNNWGYGGYGYWNGYWDGYHDGYWDNHNGYPYHNPNYFGQRRMITSPGGGGGGTPRVIGNGTAATAVQNPRTTPTTIHQTGINGRTTGTTAEIQPKTTRTTTQDGGNASQINKTPADQRHYHFEPAKTPQNTGNMGKGNHTPDGRPVHQQPAPAPKYGRTDAQPATTRTTETQNYSSPAYRQLKYSQEYINPRTQAAPNTATGPNVQRRPTPPVNNTTQGRVHPTPSTTGKRFSTPSGNSSNTRSYSTPTRSGSSSGYSSPSRSYSTPSSGGGRSGGGSSSAPARSGGSSGSSGSGGGHRK